MHIESYDDEKNDFFGKASFGITDMAEDFLKAEGKKFTKKAVTLYPDNKNPGKITIK